MEFPLSSEPETVGRKGRIVKRAENKKSAAGSPRRSCGKGAYCRRIR